MNDVYGQQLDLNLLRVFAVVAETGSVTKAAARLYLTQPAISAALRRLSDTLGARLFAKQGRTLALTERGEHLLRVTQQHLPALVEASLSPLRFDAKSSTRVFKLGLSDSVAATLLPALLQRFEKLAPHVALIAQSVHFRNVSAALVDRVVDLAITVSDDVPRSITREPLYGGGFVCLYNPRRVKLPRRVSLKTYLAHDHIVVSYNSDLKGIVEDMHGIQRRVRCSVNNFYAIGPLLEGCAVVATVPEHVARQCQRERPFLRTALLPFSLDGATMDMLWRTADTDDDAHQFLREHVTTLLRKR